MKRFSAQNAWIVERPTHNYGYNTVYISIHYLAIPGDVPFENAIVLIHVTELKLVYLKRTMVIQKRLTNSTNVILTNSNNRPRPHIDEDEKIPKLVCKFSFNASILYNANSLAALYTLVLSSRRLAVACGKWRREAWANRWLK